MTRYVTALATIGDTLYGACNDGTFWYRKNSGNWHIVDPIPQPAPASDAMPGYLRLTLVATNGAIGGAVFVRRAEIGAVRDQAEHYVWITPTGDNGDNAYQVTETLAEIQVQLAAMGALAL